MDTGDLLNQGWTNAYVGIPFKLGGRDPDGIDCWGLVGLVYHDVFGIDVRGHFATREGDGWWEDAELAIHTHRDMDDTWERVPPLEDLREADVMLFRIFGHECHVGLYLNPLTFLHAFNGHPVGLDRVRRWQQRWVGTYRHRELRDV